MLGNMERLLVFGVHQSTLQKTQEQIMPYRDWNGFKKWGHKPDSGVTVTPSPDLFLFALMPIEGAQFQDRVDIAGGVLVVARSAADARLVAAESEYLHEDAAMPAAGITHSSAFRDEKLYHVQQIDQNPVEGERALVASEFKNDGRWRTAEDLTY